MPDPTRADAMRWASATSVLPSATDAAAEVARAIGRELGDSAVDLAIAFFTAEHVPGADMLAATLTRELKPHCLAGVSARGVVSTAHEIEGGAALTVIAACLPGARLAPFVVTGEGWDEALDDPLAFARMTPGAAGAELVMVLADPFSVDIDRMLAAFNVHAPGVRVVGGMTSVAARPRANALILNDWVSREGGIAIGFGGDLRIDVIVSQGCRPIGPVLEVTRADGNLMIELDGQPALERTEQVLQELDEPERARLQHGLYLGRPARAEVSGRGDYLIRNLLGADRDRGVIAVGDRVTEKEKVRFHVRDAATAKEDLEMLLTPQAFDTRAGAALLFACNGRGRGLYGRPDGDIAILQGALGGGIPTAGMFCAGELGPVGARNFVHGHTASIAVMRPKGASAASGGA